MRRIIALVAVIAAACAARAWAEGGEPGWYNLHYQATVIDQGHARFRAPYSGANSQLPDPESADSITSTVYFGARLWRGAELYVDPELAGGRGMSSTLGIAGFPNGEITRVGDPRPTITAVRLFVKQVFGSGEGRETVSDGANQLPGTLPDKRLTVAAGKLSLMDYFDDNRYSHDPRTQFMNWALVSSLAWDYPADTRGYTWGFVAEYREPQWAARAAAVAEPKVANLMAMDRRLGRAHGTVGELERSFSIGGRKGTARVLGYYNTAHMGSYDDSLVLAARTASAPDVTLTRAYGRAKWGFATSDELELTEDMGAFLRVSWDDGHSETWAASEVDRSVAAGLDRTAARLGRPEDHWGLAQVVNGLSAPHRRYLAGGGYGFMLGDGALRYGPELITETYYKLQANSFLAVSPDAQLVVNPGYNRDRGPIPVWSVRVHAEF